MFHEGKRAILFLSSLKVIIMLTSAIFILVLILL